MARYRILPYRQGSRSAQALAEAFGGRVLRLHGSRFIPRRDDLIINWGNTEEREFPCRVLNPYNVIRRATNKRVFFDCMSNEGFGECIPPYWVNAEDIPEDAFENGGKVVCRTVLAGHSGEGIIIASSEEELVPAPLYVKYIKKADEYRVHLGKIGDDIFLIAHQRKARRDGVPDQDVNWQVRNLLGGFIFVRTGYVLPEAVFDVASRSLQATGLDFGAVDVIYNARQARAYVLEVNTAPGLEGQTPGDYADFFRNLINN